MKRVLYEGTRDCIQRHGYDADTTPIDTLMADAGLGFAMAHTMEGYSD